MDLMEEKLRERGTTKDPHLKCNRVVGFQLFSLNECTKCASSSLSLSWGEEVFVCCFVAVCLGTNKAERGRREGGKHHRLLEDTITRGI